MGDGASSADTGGQPDAGCRSQSVNFFSLIATDDDARTNKAYSGHNPLNDAACVGAVLSAAGKHDQCCAKRYDAERPHARWLAMEIAVKAQRHPSQHCND